jgi:hypothetical protein
METTKSSVLRAGLRALRKMAPDEQPQVLAETERVKPSTTVGFLITDILPQYFGPKSRFENRIKLQIIYAFASIISSLSLKAVPYVNLKLQY